MTQILVELLKDCPAWSLYAGEIAALPADVAERLIRQGRAVAATPPPVAEPPPRRADGRFASRAR